VMPAVTVSPARTGPTPSGVPARGRRTERRKGEGWM
jgi:hypothetical protein